uniref:Dolichol phosphate-mannose biosynthesis regulatory protein n=1 Tax=Steinernema glaseri TaxID=37863 RepID=A0A1I7ZJZ8_9BILA
MLPLVSFDRPLGYCILASFGICVPYLLIWLLLIPFIEPDAPLRLLFPSQKYALLIPLLSFLSMVGIVGLSAIGIFVSEWIRKIRGSKKNE